MPRSFASSRSSQSDKDKKNRNPQPVKPEQTATNDAVFSLGAIQHLDREGKVITDPDRSNPTRPRLERPLDTIRGFEAAIQARRGENVI